LHADLGLAMTLEARDLVREDMRVMVMSATLAGEEVAELLGAGAARGPAAEQGDGTARGDAARGGGVREAAVPIIRADGRVFPVETRYLGRGDRRGGEITGDVARAVLRALAEDEGDVLVFLPGVSEIRRVEALLGEAELPAAVRVLPLYGDLPDEAQELAIAPARPGERKVVLATSIAETSRSEEHT